MQRDYSDIGLGLTNIGILALIAFSLYITGSPLVFLGLSVLFVKKPVPIEYICKECGEEMQSVQTGNPGSDKVQIAYQIAPLFHFWD